MHEAADHIIDLYERHAQAWDRVRCEHFIKHFNEQPWLDRFRLAMPNADGRVLDIGCGAAEPMARYLIDAGHRITGIDSSASLIAVCEQRFPQHDWRVADMRELKLDESYSGILAWDSFFHLTPDDQRKMFPIFQAHSLPGTALMFTSGTTHGEAIGQFEGEPLYHGSLDRAEYLALLETHGFRVVEQVTEDPACGGHTIWLGVFVE